MNAPQDSSVVPAPSEILDAKERLLALAKDHNVLRMSAEKGLSVAEAIRVLEEYGPLLKKHSLPKEQYDRLV